MALTLDEEIEMLVAQRNTQVGEDFGFADYELRAIRNEGGFSEHALYALGFSVEPLGMQEAQAVSCNVCGGLFRDELRLLRRHRLQCGWDAPN